MLEKRQILAHRGAWTNVQGNQIHEKNSLEALKRAAILGYGLETDIRDRDGQLVISHDPPSSDSPSIVALDFQEFKAPLALNVKADGLVPLLLEQMSSGRISGDFFFFDMSIPEEMRYAREGLPFASRLSESETRIAEKSNWLWLDGFLGNGYLDGLEQIIELAGDRRIAVVSPELHGRDHDQSWPNVAALMSIHPTLHLCTDYPEMFSQMFGASNGKS